MVGGVGPVIGELRAYVHCACLNDGVIIFVEDLGVRSRR